MTDSLVHERGEFRLENHAQSMAELQRAMSRVQTSLSPKEFIECVSLAFQEMQAKSPLHVSALRHQASFRIFVETLTAAKLDLPKPISLAVLGCGWGLGGIGPSFAAQVAREVFAEDIGSINEIAVTSQMLVDGHESIAQQKAIPFDLVVSFSLLHFLPNLGPAFRLVNDLLHPKGAFVMAHEPNARYWRNSECQQTYRQFQRSKRPRQIAHSVGSRLARVIRPSRLSGGMDLYDSINQELRTKLGFIADLTRDEIGRIVDVHRPGAIRSNFKIGLDGFDFEDLNSGYLKEYELKKVLTSGHLAYNEPQCLAPRWQQMEQSLAEKYPLDGCVFCSYWRRR
jgi:hypothetical protein